MICITGNEPTLPALEARLLAHPDAFHEVRLDALRDGAAGVIDLIRRHRRAMVCCRPERAGGAFTGSEADRRMLLRRAAEAGSEWIDLERDALEEVPKLRSHGAKVIGSHHDFSGMPSDLGDIAAQIAASGVDAVKIAVQVHEAAELTGLREQLRTVTAPKVVIGMGRAGRLSRIRYRQFESLWTYVTSVEETATAEGQLTLEEAKLLGLPQSADAPFVALIGDSRIGASPGPSVYNRLFRAKELPWSYVAVETLDPVATLDVLRDLGALGASVTIPHKKAILGTTRADSIAARAGATNTVRFRSDVIESTNTDVIGVARPLARALRSRAEHERGARALILGRGGAAAAAAVACEDLGLSITAIGRDRWSDRTELDAEILINATPVVDSTIWPAGVPLRKKVVFDMALGPAVSPLLIRARSEGAMAIGPREMWVEQGAEQMSWITGVSFSAEELRSALE